MGGLERHVWFPVFACFFAPRAWLRRYGRRHESLFEAPGPQYPSKPPDARKRSWPQQQRQKTRKPVYTIESRRAKPQCLRLRRSMLDLGTP